MKKLPLFPNKCRKYGIIIFFAGLILLILNHGFWVDGNLPTGFRIPLIGIWYSYPYISIVNEYPIPHLIGIFGILGLVLIAFSKEKIEDEFIERIRLNSIIWAIYINYLLLVAGLIFVWGLAIWDLLAYNTITILIIFLIRFRILLTKLRRLR